MCFPGLQLAGILQFQQGKENTSNMHTLYCDNDNTIYNIYDMLLLLKFVNFVDCFMVWNQIPVSVDCL